MQRSAALSEQMVASLNAGDPTGGGMLPVNEENPSRVVSRLRKLVQLSEGKPALVFWCGDEKLSAEQLYRHLRGLNRILIPKARRESFASIDDPRAGSDVEFVAADNGMPSQNDDTAGGDMVIFRHADANVMMQTIPALNEPQVARLFGPAISIVFAPDEAWGGGVKRARRASASEYSTDKFLTLSREQMSIISQHRDNVSRRRISDYLERNAPSQLSHLDMRDRDVWIASNLAEARSFGVRSDVGGCYLLDTS